MSSNNSYGLAANREAILSPETPGLMLSSRGKEQVPNFPYALECLIGQRLGCKEEIDGVPLRTPELEENPTFDQLDDARLGVVSTMSDLLVARLWLRPDASEAPDDPSMEITNRTNTPVVVARYVLALAGMSAKDRVVDGTYAYSVVNSKTHGERCLRRRRVHEPRVTGALGRKDPMHHLLIPAPTLSKIYPDKGYRGPVPYDNKTRAFNSD